MKKFFKIVAVIALLGGVTLGCTKDYTKEIEDLQKQDSALSSKITEIENTIALLKKSDADFTTRIASLESLVETYKVALQGQITDLDGKVSGLSGKVDGLASQINDLYKQVDALDGKIDGEIGKIDEKYAKKVEEINKQIADVLMSIQNLDEKYAQKIADVMTSIGTLDEKVDNLDAKFTEQIAGILQDIEALKAKDAELQQAIDGAKERLTTAEQAIVDIKNWCTSLQGQVNALAARIQSIVAAPSKFNNGDKGPWELTKYCFSSGADTSFLAMAFDVTPAEAAKAITKENAKVLIELGYQREGNRPTAKNPDMFDGPKAFDIQTIEVKGSRVYVTANVKSYIGSNNNWKHYVSLQVTGTDAAGEVCKVSQAVAAAEKVIDLNQYLTWVASDGKEVAAANVQNFSGFQDKKATQRKFNESVCGSIMYAPLQSFEWTSVDGGGAASGDKLLAGAKLCVSLDETTLVTLEDAEKTLGFPEGTLAPQQMTIEAFATAINKTTIPQEIKNDIKDFIAMGVKAGGSIKDKNMSAPFVTDSKLNPLAQYKNATEIKGEEYEYLFPMFKFACDGYDQNWTATLPNTLDKRDYYNTVGVTGINAVAYSVAGLPVAVAMSAVRVNGNEEPTLKPIKAELNVPFGVDEAPAANWGFYDLSWYGTDGELAIYEDAPWTVYTTKDGKKDAPAADPAHFCLWAVPSAKMVCESHVTGVPYAKEQKAYIARSEDATVKNIWDNVVTVKAAEVDLTIAARHADVKVDIVNDEVVTISKTEDHVTFLNVNYADSVFVDAQNWLAQEYGSKADSIAKLEAWYNEIPFQVDSVLVDCEKAPASVYAQITPSYAGWAIVVYGIDYGKSYEVFMHGTKDDITLSSTYSFVTMEKDFSIGTTAYVVDGKARVKGQSFEDDKKASEMGKPGKKYVYALRDINFENYFVVNGTDKIDAREKNAKVDVAATYTKGVAGKGLIYKDKASNADKMVDYSIKPATAKNTGYIDGSFAWNNYQGLETTLTATLHTTKGAELGKTTVTLWTIAPIKATFGEPKEFTMTPAQDLEIYLDDELAVYGAYVGDEQDIDYNEEYNMWSTIGVGPVQIKRNWKEAVGKAEETPTYGEGKPKFDWTKAVWTLNGQAWVPTKDVHYTVNSVGEIEGNFLTIKSDNVTGTITVEVPCTISTSILGEKPATATYKATIKR